jgi:hypothetical protein
MYDTYFKEFKEFHDHKYKTQKGETLIWIEFYIFLFLYTNLVLSYMLTSFVEPGKIPDDPLWDITVPSYLSEEQQLEHFALTLAKREEVLLNNRNILTDENLNESRSTASKIYFI